MKTIPSGSGGDAVLPEFAKLDWLNLHIAHKPYLRLTLSPPTDPSSSISDSPAATAAPRPPCCFIFAYAYVL